MLCEATIKNRSSALCSNLKRNILDIQLFCLLFAAQAMMIGSEYYVTFDRVYYNFRSECGAYLLASDFLDRNFSVAVSFDSARSGERELLILINGTLTQINTFTNVSVNII